MILRPVWKLKETQLHKPLKPICALNCSLYTTQATALNHINQCITSHAHQLLDEKPQRDQSRLNNKPLLDYTRNGFNNEALHLFVEIHSSGTPIEGLDLSSALKACACLGDQVFGRAVHSLCVKKREEVVVGVGTALVDMYMKSGWVDEGKKVFDDMPDRNVVSWTSLLVGYNQNGMAEKSLEVFCGMQVEGIKPNPFTFASVLAANGAAEKGNQAHGQIIKLGYESTTFVGNSLISMYAKSGLVGESMLVFEGMNNKDVVTWNGVIAGLVLNGFDVDALRLFHRMGLAGVQLSRPIFATVIRLCVNLRELGLTRQLHCRVLKTGFEYDHNIRTALVVAYSKCSEMDDAFGMFSSMDGQQNVVSWTAMISGHLQNGRIEQATHLFCRMSREGVRPNHFTYSTILTAFSAISPLQIHAQVMKTGYENSPSVGTALLIAYVKLGNMNDAAIVFRQIDAKDIVAWSAMLAGYAQIGDPEGAVQLFKEMLKGGFKPNEFTFSSIINASAGPMASVEQGRQCHGSSIKCGFSNALCVSSALVTMYAKRGSVENAHKVFRRQTERDLVSWNSMISCYAQHGYGRKALEVFNELHSQGLRLDGITFIGVITACTHAGLVDDGRNYFDSMIKDHQIDPTMELYACMVDLYSRAGRLEEAMELIKGMSFPAGATVWRTLLGACRVHLNVELGKLAGEKLISLEPQDSAAYVLLSNIYSATGKWEEKAKVRKLMDERKVKKEVGYSWIEVKNKTHSFKAADRLHPMSEKIYAKLQDLNFRLKDAGYCPDTSFVLHDVEDEHKEAILSQHSERLAIAFGLIATPPGTPLQIVKNLRVCGDCHTVIKLISSMEGREIIVRDSNRFHHFKEGSCSCGEYW